MSVGAADACLANLPRPWVHRRRLGITVLHLADERRRGIVLHAYQHVNRPGHLLPTSFQERVHNAYHQLLDSNAPVDLLLEA